MLPRSSAAALSRSVSRGPFRQQQQLFNLTRAVYGPPVAHVGLLGSSRRYESTKASVPSDPSTKAQPPAPKSSKPDAPLLTRAWKKVKHEAHHYWSGTKLLVSEVRIASRLQWKILHGEALTRRERRQVSYVIIVSKGKILLTQVFSSNELPKIC